MTTAPLYTSLFSYIRKNIIIFEPESFSLSLSLDQQKQVLASALQNPRKKVILSSFVCLMCVFVCMCVGAGVKNGKFLYEDYLETNVYYSRRLIVAKIQREFW